MSRWQLIEWSHNIINPAFVVTRNVKFYNILRFFNIVMRMYEDYYFVITQKIVVSSNMRVYTGFGEIQGIAE